ncbi:T9SS type A sorting domain-containing protein [Epilithonimonas zeae]|uniref:T9SS type A sorting domain-containing protein n=1 Tax=Epilithonimonas zeae TaxID=1416779 RepID=UPI00200C5B85|nr:T9SS type A sorting domain-containing protein [Epilithonimonas zeae]UQB68881.1 T9SS type A sorting domain-containing protein [Epilithonimonas zeae]
MRKFLLLTLLMFSVGVASQSPGGVSGVDLWLKADSDNVNLSYYQDFGYGQHQVQAPDMQSRPTYGLVNFNDSFTFDGQKNSLNLKYLMELLSKVSIFTVFQNKNLNKESAVYTTDNSGEKELYFGTANIFRYNGDAMEYANVNQLDSAVSFNVYSKFDIPSKKIGFISGNTGKSTLYIGKDVRTNPEWQLFKGNLPELFIYNKILTLNERTRINSYLAIKYGISLPYTEYLSSKSKKLWREEDYNEFPNRITGIGRDDFSALYQKQSTNSSESKRLVISAGELSVTNKKNTATFGDQSFLVWGDNGKELKAGEENFGFEALQRLWKARFTSEQSQSIKTSVLFNVKDIFPNIPSDKNVWLIIDKEGSGNFSTQSDAIPADQINSKGEAKFSEVYFDQDLSGTDVFTFALASQMFALYDLVQPSCITTEGKLLLNIKGGKAPFQLTLTSDKGYLGNTTIQNSEISYNQLSAGHYILKVKDALSYEQVYEFDINPFDDINLNLGSEYQIGSQGYVELDASQNITDFEASYEWTSDSGFSSFQPRVKLYEEGTYTVTVTTKDGCKKTGSFKITKGIENSIVLYPNPTRAGEDFNIRIRLSQSEDADIKMYDMSGKLISSKQLQGKSSYDIKDRMLSQGSYVITIVTETQQKTFKLIIN